MLSISNPMSAANLENYFMRLAQEKYYASALEEPGHWYGEGAARLGLNGTVARAHFHNLLAGLSPDGRQPLVQNAGKPDRQAGWDLTFSAPKSVSVFWATAPESVRLVVEEAHRHAVEQALAYLEKTAGITRRGKGGKIKERAALAFALFQHGSSRADDPQLHLHAVLSNVGLRRDGTAGALQSRDFFRLKMELGARYQQGLAAQLHSRLGLKMERAKIGYRIAGVPQSLCKAFSKRRQTMEKSMQARGEHGAVAAKEAALRTRQRKKNVPRTELFAAWQQEAAAHGWTQADSLRLIPADKQQELARDYAAHMARQAKAPRQTQEPVAGPPLSEQRSGPVTAKPEPAHEEVKTGFEDYADFVGPVRPAEQRAKRQSAPTGQDRSAPHPDAEPSQPRESKEASGATKQHESDRTGFEDYPDFVGPVRPEPKATRPQSAGPARKSNPARERRGNKQRSSSQARGQRAGSRDQNERQQARTKTSARGRKRGPRKTAWSRKAKWTKSQSSRPRRRSPRLKSPVRVEWQRLFPKAPAWSPARRLKAPVLVLNRPQVRRQRPRKWGRVLWSKNLIVGEVRVQKRRLFPKAPQWSPARKLTLPVVRVVVNTPPPNHQQTMHRSH